MEFCVAFPQTNQRQALCIQIFLMGDLLVHQTDPYCPHENHSHHHRHLILAHPVLHLVETPPSVYIRHSCNHLSRGQRLMHLCNEKHLYHDAYFSTSDVQHIPPWYCYYTKSFRLQKLYFLLI